MALPPPRPDLAVAERLSIILTTSPVRSNPSTALIETTLESCHYCPGLLGCPLVIVCDGYKVCSLVADLRWPHLALPPPPRTVPGMVARRVVCRGVGAGRECFVPFA